MAPTRHSLRQAALALILTLALLAGPAAAKPLPPYDGDGMKALLATDPARVRAQGLPYLQPGAEAQPQDLRDAARNVAIASAMLGDYAQGVVYAQHFYDRAKAEKNIRMMAGARNNMGAMYQSLGRLQDAISAFRSSTRLAQQAGDTKTWASALGNLANLLSDYGNYQTALPLSLQAQEVMEKHAGGTYPAVGLIGRAQMYHFLGQRADALATLAKADAGIPKDDWLHRASVAATRSLIADAAGKLDESERNARLCVDLLRKAQIDPVQSYDCEALIGSVAVKRGDLAAAHREVDVLAGYLARMPEGPGIAKVNSLERYNTLLADLAKAEGRSEDAARYIETASGLARQLSAAREASGAAYAAAEIQDEGKDISITLLEQRNANLLLRAREQRIILIASVIGLVLALLIAALAWRDSQARRRLNAALDKTARQRETFVKDIQHRTKNNLQIILSLLNTQVRRQRELLSLDSAAANLRSAELVHDLRNRIDAMRHLHQKLYQGASGGEQVLAPGFIGDLVKTIGESYGDAHAVETVLAIDPIALPCETALSVGLIVSEIMSNVHKHADATRVTIAMHQAGPDGPVTLSVADNGKGIAQDDPASGSAHSGMSLIRDLADQIYGRADLSSSPDGTIWTLTFPPG